MHEDPGAASGPIRVGEFVLDPRSGELRGDAGRQSLSAQPLHVLLALLDRPGELVTRDELRQRLWPADTYVDFEHGLNAIVKRLRDALGDAADTPRYIETVPRRGYRLVAAGGSRHPRFERTDSGTDRSRAGAGSVPRAAADGRSGTRTRSATLRPGGGLIDRGPRPRRARLAQLPAGGAGGLRRGSTPGGARSDAAHLRAWAPDRCHVVA